MCRQLWRSRVSKGNMDDVFVTLRLLIVDQRSVRSKSPFGFWRHTKCGSGPSRRNTGVRDFSTIAYGDEYLFRRRKKYAIAKDLHGQDGLSSEEAHRSNLLAAKSASSIPVVAKVTPNLTDMAPAALAAQQRGTGAVSAVDTLRAISHVNVDYNASSNYHRTFIALCVETGNAV